MTNKKSSETTKYRWGCRETGSLMHCWWVCKMVQLLWKTFGTFSRKTKHATVKPPSDCTSGHLSQRNENFYSHTNLCMNVHSIFFHNSQKLETQMSFNRWMVKQTVIQLYHGILLINKKEQTIDIHSNLNESPGKLCWVKQANHKKLHTVWFHLYDTLDKIIEMESRLVVARGQGWGYGGRWRWTWLSMATWRISVVLKFQYFDCDGGYMDPHRW